jgi:polysaccharide transporter, PST family
VLRRILTNMSWSSGEQIVRMLVGLITSVWLARYLGPGHFGTYNLVLSTIAIASSLVPLAADQIVQRELIRTPHLNAQVLSAALFMRAGGAILAASAAAVAIGLLRPEQPGIEPIALFAGLVLLLSPLDALTNWFASQLNQKPIFFAKVPALLIVFALRLGLIAAGAPLLAFVAVLSLEMALSGIALLRAYRISGHLLAALPPPSQLRHAIWRDSWPLVIAGITSMLYLKIDVLMLAALKGDAAVGIYGAATRLSEVWYAIPMIVSVSLQPLLYGLHENNPAAYASTRTLVYALMAWSALAIGLMVTLLATPVCVLLFGPSFSLSAPVLSIHIWACIPMFLGVADACFLITEGRIKTAMARPLVGLITNVALNAALIPPLGAVGAAIATVVSYTGATFCVAIPSHSRNHALAMARALTPAGLLDIAAWAGRQPKVRRRLGLN